MSGMGASRPPQSLRCVAIETPTAGGRAATAKTTGPPVQAPRKLPASASSRKAHDNAGSRGLCCMCGSDQLLEIPTGPQKPTRCWTYATYCQRHSCSIGRDAQSQPSTPCKTHGPRAKLTDPVGQRDRFRGWQPRGSQVGGLHHLLQPMRPRKIKFPRGDV